MRKYILAIIIITSLVLSGCDSNAGSVDLTINETAAEITEVTSESIHMNNCGGKGDAKQSAERSKSVNVEFSGTLGVDKVVISGEVSAKYSVIKESAKKIELVAPANTNMEFVIEWTEKTWLGIVTEQTKGEQANYKISVPISVELVSSRDLGCNPEAGAVDGSGDSPVEISAYCAVFDNSPSYANAGQEIILRWSWTATTNAYRQDYIDSVAFSLQLDGAEIDTSPASITLTTNDSGEYYAGWRIPPITLSEGTHQVVITEIFNRQIMDGFDSDNNGSLDVFEPGRFTHPPCEIIVR